MKSIKNDFQHFATDTEAAAEVWISLKQLHNGL